MLLRKCFAALALLSILLAPVSSQAHPLYTVSLLPGVDFAPAAMNNAGQIVGFASAGIASDPGAVQAVLYSAGVLTGLGSFGGRASFATAINDAGAITGSFQTLANESHAFLYQDGSFVDIGAGTSGNGINARGDVVGAIQSALGVHGFVYSAGTLTQIGNLGSGRLGFATGINDAGDVVGESTTGYEMQRPPVHPYLYRGGALRDLGALGDSVITSASAINNAGQIAGYGETTDGTHAFLYDGAVMQDLGSFGGATLSIHDLNEHGTLVGTASEEEQGLIPFISLGGVLVDLNTLIDPALGWHMMSAYANNDVGQIVGWACQEAQCGMVRLDLASAVPEPAVAWLLVPGLLLLAVARQGRWCRQSLQCPSRIQRQMQHMRAAAMALECAPFSWSGINSLAFIGSLPGNRPT